MLNVSFKTKIEKKQEVKIKKRYQPREEVGAAVRKAVQEALREEKRNKKTYQPREKQVRNDADEMDALMQRELRGIRGNRPRVKYCSADGRYNSCGNRGNLNFNIGLGW